MDTALLIDQDEEVRSALKQWLLDKGWNVLEAANGEIGWEFIQDQKPDLVICDLLMPRCNGFRLCQLVRSDKRFDHVKFIISSGRGYPGDRLNAIDAGADDYLVKPVDYDQLQDIFNQLTVAPFQTTFLTRKPEKPRPAPREENEPPLLDSSQPTWFKFWGVRGSIPTPGPSTLRYGGNTTCVEVRAAGRIIILDAGSGMRQLGLSLQKEFAGRPLDLDVLITHTHWDHIQGFPFFVPAYNPANQVYVYGFEGARDGLKSILTSQMESPYFPVSLREMPANVMIRELKDMEFDLGEVQVKVAFANHPGICVGYRLNTPSGSIAFFPDNEPHTRFRGNESLSPENLAFARKQDERLIEFIRDVDVLIIDSQYDDTEYQSHVGWGHGCLDDVVSLALFAGVKKLFLFHHDPDHTDAQVDRMVAWARNLVTMHGDALVVEGAREGSEFVLEPTPTPVPPTA